MRPIPLLLIALVLFTSACQSQLVYPANVLSTDLPAAPAPLSPSTSNGQTGAPTATPTGIPAGTPTRIPTSTPAVTLIPPTATSTPLPRTTLLFTGVIVPARCVQAAIDLREDPDYPYEEVQAVISQADLAIGTLNATISDYPPRTGCIPTYVLVGGAENADALHRAGFDAMSVATNHIKNCGLANCGDRAFFETLKNLRRVDIQPVGAGRNHTAAMQPLVIEVNGVRFGIVSLGQIESMAFADENTPGIAVLDEANLRSAIATARKVADVVIAMPHWGPEDVPMPNPSQRQLARVAVEAGADLVVGNHTHVIQAFQEIDGVPVFYGLGNFVFDQDVDREHMQGVILLVTFDGQRLVGYELIPTHVDADGRVHLADAKESTEILERIQQVNERLP